MSGELLAILTPFRLGMRADEFPGGPSPVVGFGHTVADPALVKGVGGPGRVIAQLAAERLHEGAHHLRASGLPPAPRLAQEVIVGHDPSRAEREHAEQLVFGGRLRPPDLHPAPDAPGT